MQEEALKGLLFVSNTFALATYELSGGGQGGPDRGGADKVRPVLVEPLPNETGVDFEKVLDVAREKALAGWRFRGAIRGRAQVSG